MCKTESSSSINLDEELKKAVWTTSGPLTGKSPQLSTIISPQATVNPNNNQEEKGSAVKGIDERKNSDGVVSAIEHALESKAMHQSPKHSTLFYVQRLPKELSRSFYQIVSIEECTPLLDACSKSCNKHLVLSVLLAITTGIRQGEILGLTWDCISFDR